MYHKTLCTLSDYNYLNKGLALYESLLDTTSDFTLYYLGIDDRTCDKLNSLKLNNLKVLSVTDINKEPPFKGPEYPDYCFHLVPFLIQYLIKNVSSVVYIDSDMFFFNDINLIYDEIGDNGVGLMPDMSYKQRSFPCAYNDSPIYFKNDEAGLACLNFWVDCLQNSRNPYYSGHHAHGCQLYLFEEMFPDKVHVIEAGQGAPWNFQLFKYDNRMVSFNAKISPLVFVHFSKFNFNNQDDVINDNSIPYNFSSIPAIKELYVEYFLKLKKINKHF